MSKISLHPVLAGLACLGLVWGFNAAQADSTALSYEVTAKAEGYVMFQLKAQNISREKIFDVTVEAANSIVPTLAYGDIMPGYSATQPVTLTWEPAAEPPALIWTVSYTDARGQVRSEIK